MPSTEHELRILQEIERNPATTQATLASQLGVAVGSVNWYVKRLVGKGYIKVTHLERRKLRYFLTPSGLALKVKLTKSYMDVSLRTYRELRAAARELLTQTRQAGYDVICFDGDGEAIEILRLTCLELGVAIEQKSTCMPCVLSTGIGFEVVWPVRNETE